MSGVVFCPACLSRDTLSSMRKLRTKQECVRCGARFPLSATLISEDAVRVYIKEQNGKADQLLKELDALRKR